jgi:hypothetical protein
MMTVFQWISLFFGAGYVAFAFVVISAVFKDSRKIGMSPKVFCKHYQGMSEKNVCEAGVRFDSLPHFGTRRFFDTCPCFGPQGTCEHAIYPTPEELAAEEAEFRKLLENLGKARAAIVGNLGGPWKRGTPGASGEIDCPVCSGSKTLQFSRAGYNGHIHAACSTEGCVRWME